MAEPRYLGCAWKRDGAVLRLYGDTLTGELAMRMTTDHQGGMRPMTRWESRRVDDAIGKMRMWVEEHPWALAADRELAERIAATGDLEGLSAERVFDVHDRAGRVYGSTTRRLREWPMNAFLVSLAARPEVRATAHEACRLLTAMDADRAQVRNRKGWSPSTTFPGHLLAGMDALGERETVYAIELLHKHRRQLPPAMAAVLFEGYPL